MQIESTLPSLVGDYSPRVQSERAIQSVFASVLAETGQQGFISAEAPSERAPTSEEITESWQNWLAAAGQSRYRGLESPTQSLDEFQSLLIQAVEANAYAAPQAFLSQLPSEQLSTIQAVHHLAAPINVDALTLEGSLNLLLPPPAQVDLDNDGLTQSGAGTMIRFPDSRTPRAVADAWHQATASLPPEELAIRQLQMKADVLLANIHVDKEGRFSHRSELGDEDWVNPMASPGFSYLSKTRATLESIEHFKLQTPPEQYARDHKFWREFHSALVAHGAR